MMREQRAENQQHVIRWPGASLTRYVVLGPMLLLLAAELLALILLAPPRTGDASPLGLVLMLAVLVAGFVPAFMRPSAATNLIGCSAIVLASVVWRAPQVSSGAPAITELAAALGRNDIRLSLLNVVLLAPLTLHLAARFPQHSTLERSHLAGYYLLVVGLALAAMFLPASNRPAALLALVFAAYAGFGLAGFQFLRTIRSVQPKDPRAAQQARLLLLSLTLAEVPLLLLPLGGLFRLLMPYELIVGAQVVLPIGVAYAVLRHNLFGVDAALRRALDYALVSFGLLVIYFGLAAVLTQLSRELGPPWGFAATVLSVLVAAAAFTPLRRITQQAIDHSFYPERLHFGQTIAAAQATLARVVERDAVVGLFEEQLSRQLGADWAKLVLRPSFEHPAGADEAGVWSTLLIVGGQTIGGYWLGPRRSGLPYATHEQAQLHALAQQAALALAYAETVEQLRTVNDELEERVAVRTVHLLAQQRELATLEERQRLARELHDSVKQTLFSLGLGLRGVRTRIGDDPLAAAELLRQHEQTALQAQAELGELLDHLRMPAHGSADLVALLEQHAAMLVQQHGMAITQHLPPALVLPEHIARELASIAREAFHNVLRHSGTPVAELELRFADGQLRLRIADQGRGFEPGTPQTGHGLRSMQERATLLGATLDVASAPGKGTTVCLSMPLAG
jgi:signal transduction histidine kinase